VSLALVWSQGGEHVGTAARRIRRDDFGRLVQAAELLRQARERADASAAHAAAAERAGRERGHAEGLREGTELGLRQVLARLHDEATQRKRRVDALAGLLADALGEVLAGVAPEALLRAQVRRALAAAGERQAARLLVAPARVDEARALLAEWHGGVPAGVVVLASAQLGDGDVVLECQGAVFDGRIAAQLAAWRDAVHVLLERDEAADAR
jgi:flagellar biosynthesis/type III secretory pathway protein FliH